MKNYFSKFLYFYKLVGNRIFVQTFLNITVGLLDGFGLAMFLPLLQMVNSDQSASPDRMGNFKFLVDFVHGFGLELTLSTTLLFLIIFFILKGIVTFLKERYNVSLRQYFARRIRLGLIDDLSVVSFKSFVGMDMGKVQNTLNGEVERFSIAYNFYFETIQNMILVIVYISFAFFVDAKFALLISIGGLLSNFIFKTIYRKTEEASNKLTKNNHDFQGLVTQLVTYFKYLLATSGMPKYMDKLRKTVYLLEENNKRIGSLNSILLGTREPVLICIVALVIFVQVNVLGGTLASILISLLFFYRALAAVSSVQNAHNIFLGNLGSYDNMTLFTAELQANKEVNGASPFLGMTARLSLQNASFGYSESRLILKDINLEISKNETIAFVGESGSGKTTLVNILAGLFPLSHGKFFIDDKDSLDYDMHSYQSKIGYITQEAVIFNDTLYNNVTFWSEKTPENIDRFERALKKAVIYNFMKDLPEQENEILGNNGINLSGGQKQRISIARELFKEVEILVLDEATSALDSETEQNIQQNIDELKGQCTILIIAHRLSTIKNVDRVVLLNKGEIIGVDSFAELQKTSSKFQKMIDLQELD